jgi:Ca2+-binding RTX toxin-like protein
MHLRKAARLCVNRRTLALTMLVLALTAATAWALNLHGDGTIVGTKGNDNIAAGNGNDTIWGLGGVDNISAGSGNDMIDANGMCPPGVTAGVYPNGLPAGEYCSHGLVPGSSDDIAAGGGNDTVYGGGGPNDIALGGGDDTIFGGTGPDLISVGGGDGTIHGSSVGDTISAGVGTQADDTIVLGSGPSYRGSTVATGSGNDVIFAQNGVKDTISCQRGNGTTVFADRTDSVKGCAHVKFTAPTGDWRKATKARKASKTRRANHHKKAGARR